MHKAESKGFSGVDVNMPHGFEPESVMSPPLPQGPWTVRSLALDLSGSCNLSCRYCAEAASQPRRRPMGAEVADAAWNFLFPRGKKEHASLRFGSGEPLLAIHTLRQINDRIKKMRGSVRRYTPEVFLTTNGTLIDSETAEWLISSGWHLKISFDGPRPIHDFWRVRPDGSGTYEHLRKVIRKLSSRMKDRFSVTAVLCRGTDPQEVFDESEKLGVSRIELVPAVHQDESILPDHADREAYRRFVQKYADRFLQTRRGQRIPTLVRFADRVSRVMGYNAVRVPCGAGRSFYGIGPEGTIYPCFRFIGIKAYELGDLSTGLKTKAVEAFSAGAGRPFEERESCRSCWAAPLCGGPCFSCAELFGTGDGEPLAFQCAYVLSDAVAAVYLVQELRKRDPERLLSFLPGATRVL